MGCNCGKTASATKLSWDVNLNVPEAGGVRFSDGTTIKTFALASEANNAVATLGLTGRVRPTPHKG